jgi:hypothetical protein
VSEPDLVQEVTNVFQYQNTPLCYVRFFKENNEGKYLNSVERPYIRSTVGAISKI